MKLLFISFLLVTLQIISAKDFKGAEYRTKEAYTYGRFEVKMKSPGKEGILCSFFLYYDGGTGVDTWNEIDIEIMGRYNNQVQFNTITPGQVNHVRHQFLNFDPAIDFHTYGFEWTPDYVSWFVDGVEVYKQTGAHIQTLTRPQKIMMNIWNPTSPNWAGRWNPDVLPAFAYYDSVKYYQYTPGSGNYGSGNNFTLGWIDPMDSFNTARWAAATHTFNGNNCDFITNNVVFKNSTMALCLTNATNVGFSDLTKPVPLWGRNDIKKITIYFSEVLDEVTSVNASNYILSGVTINSINLKEDKRTVELNVSGVIPGNSYNLIMWNIKDTSGNVMSSKALSLINSAPLAFPIKINAGGPASMGYLADKEFNETVEYGYLDGNSSIFSNPINNTTEDSIYQSERFGHGAYNIRVPNGSYKVKLMLNENYFTEAGKRTFDIYVQSKLAANDLDIFKMAGKDIAYDLIIDGVSVTDGLLQINFCEEINNAVLNGIVVTQNPTGVLDNKTMPEQIELYQNYPNPFNGATNFTFKLNKEESVNLRIYNINGEKISSYNFNGSAGENSFFWNARDNNGNKLTSGVYFYTLNGETFNQTKKLIILN